MQQNADPVLQQQPPDMTAAWQALALAMNGKPAAATVSKTGADAGREQQLANPSGPSWQPVGWSGHSDRNTMPNGARGGEANQQQGTVSARAIPSPPDTRFDVTGSFVPSEQQLPPSKAQAPPACVLVCGSLSTVASATAAAAAVAEANDPAAERSAWHRAQFTGRQFGTSSSQSIAVSTALNDADPQNAMRGAYANNRRRLLPGETWAGLPAPVLITPAGVASESAPHFAGGLSAWGCAGSAGVQPVGVYDRPAYACGGCGGNGIACCAATRNECKESRLVHNMRTMAHLCHGVGVYDHKNRKKKHRHRHGSGHGRHAEDKGELNVCHEGTVHWHTGNLSRMQMIHIAPEEECERHTRGCCPPHCHHRTGHRRDHHREHGKRHGSCSGSDDSSSDSGSCSDSEKKHKRHKSRRGHRHRRNSRGHKGHKDHGHGKCDSSSDSDCGSLASSCAISTDTTSLCGSLASSRSDSCSTDDKHSRRRPKHGKREHCRPAHSGDSWESYSQTSDTHSVCLSSPVSHYGKAHHSRSRSRYHRRKSSGHKNGCSPTFSTDFSDGDCSDKNSDCSFGSSLGFSSSDSDRCTDGSTTRSSSCTDGSTTRSSSCTDGSNSSGACSTDFSSSSSTVCPTDGSSTDWSTLSSGCQSKPHCNRGSRARRYAHSGSTDSSDAFEGVRARAGNLIKFANRRKTVSLHRLADKAARTRN